MLSIIAEFYHLAIAYSLLESDRFQTTNSPSPKTSSQNSRSPLQLQKQRSLSNKTFPIA
ncbi:MAG: hypothetical protein ACKPCM_18110 [Pseudanabaena sp.]